MSAAGHCVIYWSRATHLVAGAMGDVYVKEIRPWNSLGSIAAGKPRQQRGARRRGDVRERRNRAMKVFISHATEDKESVARPLANALRERRVEVWFDEFVLRPGDSIRESIEAGLAACDYGIVILSPSFFEKRWPQSELNGIFGRALSSDRRFLFPIWHRLSVDDLRPYPMLADRFALKSDVGASVIAEQVLAVAIGDERRLREAEKVFVDFDPSSRYYNPPEEVPKLGYELRPGTYAELRAQLRPRELIIAHGNPYGTHLVAGHVTCEERMMEFEMEWWIAPKYYAVDFRKLMSGFDVSLSEREIRKLLGRTEETSPPTGT